MFKKLEKNNKEEIAPINYDLFEQIQSSGGIHFRDEKYIYTGTGYEACIHIYGYANVIREFWLTYITGLNNVTVTIDVSIEDLIKVQENLNKNIKEESQRIRESRSYTALSKATFEREKNQMLVEQLTRMDDVVRIIAIRIYVADSTIEKVDETATNIINHLHTKGYKGAIFLNENAIEWQSMYLNYTEQQAANKMCARIGQPVLASTLAKGNPFHFSSLSDDCGSYWGDTDVGGTVIFDPFQIDTDRKNYNISVFGNMGSGKSTSLKKLIKDQAIRGHYIRGFDITGEFTSLIENLGGKIINLDGSAGVINPLEILRSGNNEKINWHNHVSKLSTMYEYLVPNVDRYELAYYQIILKQFYQTIQLYPLDENMLNATTGILTGLNNQAYPTLSLFRDFLREYKESGYVSAENLRNHENVYIIINSLVENYGAIFDGHTNMDNVLREQILYFNLSSVLKTEEKILNTILFNILSLCWDNLITIGGEMKNLYDNKQIDFEDITRFLIIIDEAHRIINTHKSSTVEQILGFMREARKYFGGIVLATQSIRDYVPENASDASVDQIKMLFELSQYKFAMSQDTNVIPILKKVFNGELTETMIDQIPRLSRGEAILSLSSHQSIKFKIRISEYEKKLFAGGA